jgi:hypothetical protein
MYHVTQHRNAASTLYSDTAERGRILGRGTALKAAGSIADEFT